MACSAVGDYVSSLAAYMQPPFPLKLADTVTQWSSARASQVWPQLLADAEADELRPVYRASTPFDLALSPVPRFDLLGHGPRPRLTVQTQRGCPLACEFCGASRLLGPYRLKPIENLKRELDAITVQIPRPVLELADDNTFAGERDSQNLLETLASANARYFTEVDWRVGENSDLLTGLAASGCVQVLVGIESLVFRHPGMGPKQAGVAPNHGRDRRHPVRRGLGHRLLHRRLRR